MKQRKLLNVLFLLVFLPLVFIGGYSCSKPAKEVLLELADSTFLEKLDITISEQRSITKAGHSMYLTEGATVTINISIKTEYLANHYINETDIKNHLIAHSAEWYNLTQEEKTTLNNQIEQKRQQLLEDFSEEEVNEKLKQDQQYSKYYPLEIEWTEFFESTKISSIIGSLKVSKSAVISATDNVAFQDKLNIYTFGDSNQYNYSISTLDATALTSSPRLTIFYYESNDFTINLYESTINAPELLKIHYLYLNEEPLNITKTELINNENTLVSNLTLYGRDEQYYYQSDIIFLPEYSEKNEIFDNTYRHIVIYVEADV